MVIYLGYILLILFLIYLFLKFIFPILNLKIRKTDSISYKQSDIYTKKRLMTNCEQSFYNILINLGEEYVVIPQVCLASVINKKSYSRYSNELFRIIDFAIFNKDLNEILLLIELNDSTHNEYKRKDRDLKVKKICLNANIPLMSFYTKYPNEKEYVLNRILREIKKDSLPIQND